MSSEIQLYWQIGCQSTGNREYEYVQRLKTYTLLPVLTENPLKDLILLSGEERVRSIEIRQPRLSKGNPVYKMMTQLEYRQAIQHQRKQHGSIFYEILLQTMIQGEDRHGSGGVTHYMNTVHNEAIQLTFFTTFAASLLVTRNILSAHVTGSKSY